LPKSWVARVGAVVLLMAVTGTVAVWGAPDGGRVTGIWPAGLATGCLLLARRRSTGRILLAIFVTAFGTVWLGGRPWEVALGFSLGSTLEAFVVARLFTDGRDPRPSLRSDDDLLSYFRACGAGAVVIATAGFVTSLLTGWGNPGLVAVSVSSAHLASNMVVVPFFCRPPNQESIATRSERVIQWLTIVVVTPFAFLPTDFPSVVFVAIPVLAWGALRLSPKESLSQLVAVLAFAIFMTTAGFGPFADVPDRYDMPVDTRGVLLALFAITCAVIVVPLMIRVGEQIATARESAAERDIVQRIVDGATGIAIIGTDQDGRVTLFNPGAERLLGYESSEVLGEHTTMFHSAGAIKDKAQEFGVRANFLDVVLEMTKPSAAGTLIRFRRKDGAERMHAMTLSRLVDARGRTTGYVSTSEDVTDALEAQRALEEALEAERQAADRLREVDSVKDAFVSSVSHELRTPMTSILGYLEMLGEGAYGDLSRDQNNAVHRVSDNTQRLLGLIDDLLTLSRVDNDGFDYVDRVFDLREAVRAAYGVVSPAWQARPLAVSLGLPEEPVPLLGDRDMIERVTLNLLGNAVKFTPDGGSIYVGLDVEGDNAVITVSDSGIGVPAQEQAQLFNRFFRSTLAQKRAIPGSGLGLSITRAIVEKHGGTIDFTSEPGEGSTFRVRLPVVT
jgi:PAS domain S-box-containing protein